MTYIALLYLINVGKIIQQSRSRSVTISAFDVALI